MATQPPQIPDRNSADRTPDDRMDAAIAASPCGCPDCVETVVDWLLGED